MISYKKTPHIDVHEISVSGGMKPKSIALINYPGNYFKPFGDALEDRGFKVFWICSTTSDAVYLRNRLSVPASRVLDINAAFHLKLDDISTCRERLADLESDGRPRIYDIILMDRILRNKKVECALRYMEHVREQLTRFFVENDISLISSGRDSALQLMSMLVGRKLGIPWVVPTRLRIPPDTYGFCTGHETDTFLPLHEASIEDRHWAEDVLNKFHGSQYRPALKIAARSIKDTALLTKTHSRHFYELLKRSYYDRGNSYSRYTIPRVIKMYLRRRINMVCYNVFRPWSTPGGNPFCVYALHTQPESSIDVAGSYFSDQVALIRLIARSLPTSHELYVKIHPTDVDGKTIFFYRQIKRIPGVVLVHDSIDSRDLVNRASIIFTLTGTIGYEAGLLGRPVITFAKNFYNSLPSVHYCSNPMRLPELVESLLKEDGQKYCKEDVINFLTGYRRCVFNGEVNRRYGRNPRYLSKSDLAVLQDAYDILFERLVVAPRQENISRSRLTTI